VTTFLETGSLQIEYELDGYLPQAQCPLPLMKTKIMILSQLVSSKWASLGEPLLRYWTIS